MSVMLEDWSTWTDEKVFGSGGEEPGSRAAYWRETEIKRRLYLLQKESLEAQLDATAAQREATKAQIDAVIEMRKQSNILVASVLGVFLTALVTMIAAFIN